DGAYATRTVIQPCLNPAPGGRRIEVVTRLREDARLFRPLVAQAKAKGRPRKWGRRMAAPKHHEKWDVPWQEGEAYIYGRVRTFAVELVALTLMRLVRYRLDAAWGAGSWWSKPEWYRHKQHPSILDVRRLFWRYRQEFSQFLQELEDIEKVEEEPAPRRARA